MLSLTSSMTQNQVIIVKDSYILYLSLGFFFSGLPWCQTGFNYSCLAMNESAHRGDSDTGMATSFHLNSEPPTQARLLLLPENLNQAGTLWGRARQKPQH